MTNPEDNGVSVAPGNRPAFGYTLTLLWFYLLIIVNLFSVRIMLILVAMICDRRLLNLLNLCLVHHDLYKV
jgi:hypothetical protein